jgi:hypothetical protein
VSALLGEVSGFLDKYLIGYALGTAAGPALSPFVQDLANDAWTHNQVMPPDAPTLAMGLAHGRVTRERALKLASETGFGADAVDVLAAIEQEGPSIEQGLRLWRREQLTDAEFVDVLEDAGVAPSWRERVALLKEERLDPSVVAIAIVRGIMDNPTDPATGAQLLPVGPPTVEGKIKAFPVSSLDPLAEVAAAGFDFRRLFVQTAIAGRPMSPQEAASSTFRQIIDRVDFDRAIAEGDTRNEWADAIFEHARQIPSVVDFVSKRLRGWTDDAGMYAGTARHGMTPEDTDSLFLIHGRPPSWHQVWIGLQRGGIYNGPLDVIDAPFLKALQESDLRPEWYHLLWMSRYNYPSAFVLKALTAAGDITVAEAEQVLRFEGWEPTLAAKVAAKWAGGTTAATKTKTLTAAEVRTAEHKGAITHADALARLEAEGYSPQDAEIYLTPTPPRATA